MCHWGKGSRRGIETCQRRYNCRHTLKNKNIFLQYLQDIKNCTRDVPVDLSRESGTGGDTGHVAVARVGQLEDPEYDVVQRLLSLSLIVTGGVGL